MEQPRAVKRGRHLRADDHSQRLRRHQVVGVTWLDPAAIDIDPASRHQQMPVGVVALVLRQCVKCGEDGECFSKCPPDRVWFLVIRSVAGARRWANPDTVGVILTS